MSTQNNNKTGEIYLNNSTTNNKNNDFMPFTPKLSDCYMKKFERIVKKLVNRHPRKRTKYLNKKINELNKLIGNMDKPLQVIKLLSILCILRDLLEQDWRIRFDTTENVTKLAKPNYSNNNKVYLRQQLQAERNIQLKVSSVRSFINKMERPRKFKNKEISIQNLIGDKEILITRVEKIVNEKDEVKKLELANEAIQPYIQLVDNSKCSHTGYRIRDIWRYFRYTWSLPYKSTPGRNLFYLIRDASQPYHPIIGISALGNTVLYLTQRDDYIGWTLSSIKNMLKQSVKRVTYEEMLKGELNLKRKVTKETPLENKEEYKKRIYKQSTEIVSLLKNFIDDAITKININDLVTEQELETPNYNIIERLNQVVENLKSKQFDNKRTKGEVNWLKESKTPLFKKKRAQELAKLLEAKIVIQQILSQENNPLDSLRKLIEHKNGKIVNIALQANRKEKIGSNIMDIIVCGSIPPYNELLGGKLVSLLTCSPTVIRQYNEKYSDQVSEIASRIKGERVVKDSRLAYLGTTSLYGMGSSQYNRIKMKVNKNNHLEFKKLGKTQGFTSVFFSNETSRHLSDMLEIIEGGRRVNNVFGEGTSPRIRLLRMGLSALGIPETFIKQPTKRIIYGVKLADNSLEFLRGETNELNYYFPLDGNEELHTDKMILFWKKRWFIKRIHNNEIDIIKRLQKFHKDSILVSNNL